MPPRPPVRLVRLVRLGCAVALAGCCAWLGAAELGEPLVRSYSGQPLVADIELTALTDEGVVQVRPAHADIYRGANIAMHAALSSMSSSVMRRDGRQYLHVTTIKPVDGDHVHVFFDLAEGGRHQVRGVTLWLMSRYDEAEASWRLANDGAKTDDDRSTIKGIIEQIKTAVPRR